ncbi:MAG: MFS transporter [Muribaculaceae bacterium]|nr:MFS transporter [Muribaculaceae bacterium]
MESIVSKVKIISRESTFPVLMSLCAVHCFNDLLQSVVSAVYPMLKDDLSLTFAQIGLITLVYQIAASVFQPVVGYLFDRRPYVGSLPMGMVFTTAGIVLFAFSMSMSTVLVAVFLVGVGSSTLHPEASRITSLASHGRRGLAQSIFQVGGNLGTSVGPLLVALVVAPHGRHYIVWFLIVSAMAFYVMRRICSWYSGYLEAGRRGGRRVECHRKQPLSYPRTVFVVCVIMILIFSKYIYMASLTNYYTFYLIEQFGVSIKMSQIYLFVFLVATVVGTLVGGPMGDRYGRKPVIWVSILGTAPFSLAMPHCGLALTVVFSFCAGFMLSSAFPAILLYAQELLPNKLGLVSGLFFGFAFGVAGIAAAILGDYIDVYGIKAVYDVCAYTPLLGIVVCLIPNLKKIPQEGAV